MTGPGLAHLKHLRPKLLRLGPGLFSYSPFLSQVSLFPLFYQRKGGARLALNYIYPNANKQAPMNYQKGLIKRGRFATSLEAFNRWFKGRMW